MATLPPTMDALLCSTGQPQNSSAPETPPAQNPVPVVLCPCPSCTLSAESQLDFAGLTGGGSSNNNKRVRYAPPRPDADTFATQQAFLDYLTSVPIESVDENSRKCPICWKPYGEAADPGFDNSEQPVRLKCKHTFGDKCLRATFALPGTSTVTLRSLTFGPGSRGRLLGQLLQAYWLGRTVSKLDGYAEAFTEMLGAKRESRAELFGTYLSLVVYINLGRHWGSVVQELRRRMGGALGFHKITMLENAMILDCKRHDTRALASSYGDPDAVNSFDIPEEFTSHDFPPPHPSSCLPHIPEDSLKQQEAISKLKKDREERMAKMLKAERELQERNERHLNRMLGVELGRVYSEYLRHRATTEEPEQHETSPRQYFVNAYISVHKKNPKQSSFEIESLDRLISHFSHEAEDDNSDADDEGSDTPSGILLANLFPVVMRKMCANCCTEHTTVPLLVPVPTALWWKNSRQIPDDCPICHKILFHKGHNRQRSRNSECEISGEGDYVGIIGEEKVI